MHVFPLANETKTGVRIRIWLERVVEILKSEKKENCPAFCDEEGYQMKEKEVEAVFHPILRMMQKDKKYAEMLPAELEIEGNYMCSRSFRRGSATTALNNGVDEVVIKFVHRWGKIEAKKGACTGFNMLEHYAHGELTRPMQFSFVSKV